MSSVNEYEEYLRIKQDCKDDIVLVYNGNYVGAYDKDAVKINQELEMPIECFDIGLDREVIMAKIPFNSFVFFVNTLLNKGHTVVEINLRCNQIWTMKK